MYWALPYKGVSNAEEWIIAGQYVTNTSTEGEETAVQRMIDAQFVDGLLNYIIVYDKQPPSQD
jgi:nitrate reductase NapAB chaperone NapD